MRRVISWLKAANSPELSSGRELEIISSGVVPAADDAVL
jgi:hypothetical protein